MRIVTFRIIQEYANRHPDSDTPLREWYKKAKESEWKCFADIKQTFNSADSIGNNRFVFNIKGNDYRLIAIVIFASQKVYVRFTGTHSGYDKLKNCLTI
ncbi:MAG: type II toxin-antitoxin system HigB family toxin [Prevotellaceae bacterium]|jgi:mRNA interferase HigB|nr:type II toxin-antitoxin system HigB family toxin [Prevotellaceae bacterium]